MLSSDLHNCKLNIYHNKPFESLLYDSNLLLMNFNFTRKRTTEQGHFYADMT